MKNLAFIILSLIYRLLFIFRIKKNKIVIVSYYGKGYGDNSKYICEELSKRDKNWDVVWLVKNINEEFPSFIRKVKYGSIRGYFELATAKIWLDNCRKRYFITKRKKQIYIQLWHGGVGLKKIEQLAEDKLDKTYIKHAKHDSKMIDYAISNSAYRTNIYKNHFWYDGEILEYGCPRNDLFFDEKSKQEIKNKVYDKLNLDSTKKVILYLPTFRNSQDYDYLDFDYKKILSKMNKTKDEYCMMVKLHPNVASNFKGDIDGAINASLYPDVDELLLISDIVISDYSSVIFDALYNDCDVYLYAPDYDSYLKGRGLNFDYKKLPFSISYNSKDLVDNIVNNKSMDLKEELDSFLKEMGIVDDGMASKRVVDLLESCLEGK